ncbi:hypothetical protein PSCLAVI8L_490018 [Pseudoclavibacter sp. 8L]|nr:hypothetical protein PSCLAVI8L_490018 [Pseudoclavibacter sp. 8L]
MAPSVGRHPGAAAAYGFLGWARAWDIRGLELPRRGSGRGSVAALRVDGSLDCEAAGAHPLPVLTRQVARGRATLMGFRDADGFLGCA